MQQGLKEKGDEGFSEVQQRIIHQEINDCLDSDF
jgi:hypothetical protein